ncbi:amidohydrolase family protein, partial [uncultured Caballeronia sp.]|uniref:amidohydrolase family protein n=1 Tax=uncultured Caballeronia sp. TaxID=1827198 RepID=UPI0035CA356F
MSSRRIDVHQHLLPPEFLAALARHGMSAWAPAAWSADGAIAMMDQHDIATGVLSLSTPGPHFGDDREARLLTRQVNERLGELVKNRPERFGMFASVPLPDIDGSLEAIRHAYDDLATDGVILLASNRGVYVGDPSFDPVMEELNRRNAVVFVHPGPLPGPPIKGIHPSLADFLLDTTRAAINLVSNGIPRRYPNLRIILSHAGGFLPYAAYRISALASVVDHNVDSAAMLDDLTSFYFDTALSGSPTVLPSLLSFAKPGHVLFGSDWPYAPSKTVGFFTDNLDAYQASDVTIHGAINRKNAEALFPRLGSLNVGANAAAKTGASSQGYPSNSDVI